MRFRHWSNAERRLEDALRAVAPRAQSPHYSADASTSRNSLRDFDTSIDVDGRATSAVVDLDPNLRAPNTTQGSSGDTATLA
jgi:hypothetical protein